MSRLTKREVEVLDVETGEILVIEARILEGHYANDQDEWLGVFYPEPLNPNHKPLRVIHAIVNSGGA